MPDFSFEFTAWRNGYELIIGIDEVGRGALAGPVVAGVACLRNGIRNEESRIKEILQLGIDDSKRLTPGQREILVPLIQRYFHCSVGEASVSEINSTGIVKATQRAMRRAIMRLGLMINDSKFQLPTSKFFFLIDGFGVPYIPGGRRNQQAIIKGDQKSVSIAAASIVAKVYRDSLMRDLSKKFARYCWQENKGYGTLAHCSAITKYGSTQHHRKTFISELTHRLGI